MGQKKISNLHIVTDIKLKMDNEQERKLFVGGLNKEHTTEDELRDSFAPYGAIVNITIMRDPEKNSRGFGFIVFEDAATVDSIVSAKKDNQDFIINGKSVHVKRALPPVPGGRKVTSFSDYGKIFVGGLPHAITEEDLQTHFEQFGRITEIELLKDPQTQRLRGFAFVTFEDEDCADRCLQRRTHEICRKVVEVKKPQAKTLKERNPVQSNNTATTSSAKTIPMAEVTRLIQQAYIMGQQTTPPTPSNSQQFNNPLLQALREQLAPPKPPAPPAPAPEDPLMRVANFFHSNGVDATALADVLKETQSEGGGGSMSALSTTDSKGSYRYNPY